MKSTGLLPSPAEHPGAANAPQEHLTVTWPDLASLSMNASEQPEMLKLTCFENAASCPESASETLVEPFCSSCAEAGSALNGCAG